MDIVGFFNDFGIFGLSFVLMLETAFLPLFFLPGDTLLFSAGYLIHAGDLSIYNGFLVLGIGAFMGNIIGYYSGAFMEKKMLRLAKSEGSVFNKGLDRTRNFYKKYGLLTLIFARFIPSVRTIAPFLAGATRMPLAPFLWVSFFSGFFWVAVGLMLGKFFGKKIPHMEELMVGVVLLAVIFAVSPIVFYMIKRLWKKNV